MHVSLPTKTNSAEYLLLAAAEAAVEPLTNADQDEVLAFLGTGSLHTAYLTGLIRDNGILSSNNRGTFYGYRNNLREIEGIALIGHAILMEAVTNRGIRAFAETAQNFKLAHLIMCEEAQIGEFWSFYAKAGQEMRRASRQLVFELRWPTELSDPFSTLRPATLDDLNLLVPVHAEMAHEESGVDPRMVDEAGFTRRYARRVAQGRTWILVENGQLLFKAEIVSETLETTYIEGVWVNPDLRREGFGRGCMTQLARMLLWRTRSLCLVVNDENEAASAFFRQAGYHARGVYDTIFLK
ncbi:MAG TPA: GNAT family N-acetyltransferase [Pyrinomonadaceae bacterium]|nr:GNAT family N-acetyltransferase [Pyrinomonadaceae bacterium]